MFFDNVPVTYGRLCIFTFHAISQARIGTERLVIGIKLKRLNCEFSLLPFQPNAMLIKI